MNRLHPQMTSYKTSIALCLLCPTAAQVQLPVCKLIATGGATVPQIVKVATIEVENLSNVPSDYKARIVLEEGVSQAESDHLFRSRSRSWKSPKISKLN